MTDYNVLPGEILTDFLRVYLTDPRARAEASNSDSFTATSSQTDFLLTPTAGTSVSCVTAVTVNAAGQTKWSDYFWDYQNQKVIFFTGLTTNDAVVVTYKEGSSNWIYPDNPDDKLTEASFPRISITDLPGSGVRLGQTTAPVESSPVFQIDVWTREGYIKTIGNNEYANEYMGRYLAFQVTKAFEDNITALSPVLYNYTAISTPIDAPFSETYQAYHTIVEVNFKGLRLGRISV